MPSRRLAWRKLIISYGMYRFKYSRNCCIFQEFCLTNCTVSSDQPLQLADIDARVIDELLSDAAFLESLMEQDVQLGQENAEDGGAGIIGNNTGIGSSPGSALGLIGEASSSPYASAYESVTMKAVEEVQLSVKGILAKVSAAFESAGEMIQGGRNSNHSQGGRSLQKSKTNLSS